MKCLNNSIALRPKLMAEKISASSTLFVPETTRERSQEAEVLQVGPGEYIYGKRAPIELQPGDRVLYLRQGYTATINGESIYFVTERDILAVLDDDEKAEFFGVTIDEDVRREALGSGE